MMKKKTCVIYANCQGTGINRFLVKSSAYSRQFESVFMENYSMIRDKKPLDEGLLRRADLFIHQPLPAKWAGTAYATDHVRSLLPDSCIQISVPFIVNDALWPFFVENSKVYGGEVINGCLDRGLSLRQIVRSFRNLSLDLNYGARFDRTVALLREREEATDVKVADFVLSTLRKQRVFLTHNHPTSVVFVHCANQVLSRLGYPTLPASNYDPNETGLPGLWPITPYDSSFYGYEHTRADANWQRFYIRMMDKICRMRPQPRLLRYARTQYLRLCRKGIL